MAEPRPTKRATAADLQKLPEGTAAEVIDGEIVEKALPSFEHGRAQTVVAAALEWGTGGARGASGWWIATEVEVEYEPHEVYRHDVSGWRRDRPEGPPRGRPVRMRPDWACEVLSPSNRATDTNLKFRRLHRFEVPYYGLVDPEEGLVTSYRWAEEGYVTAAVGRRGDRLRLPPFDDVELAVDDLLIEPAEAPEHEG